MSSVRLVVLLLINQLSAAVHHSQCDLSSAFDLQAAAYRHSYILRVQPIYTSEEVPSALATRTVLLREVIKAASNTSHAMHVNDLVVIRIDHTLDEPCWQLLQIEHADVILFLNETVNKDFDLTFPPVESTLRVREHIAAVMNYEPYAPRVIIKTRMEKAIDSKDYSLHCSARGNPIPRLFWTKTDQSAELYPSAKQCKTSCRIYAVQNDYQSTLHFRALTASDDGVYVCHAENPLNRTSVGIALHVERSAAVQRASMNSMCASLTFCHERGRCLIDDNQPKCLCDSRYSGEQCEISYDDILAQHNDAFLLFKSRFFTGTLLFLVAVSLLFISVLSCLLAKYNQTKRAHICRPQSDASEQRLTIERQQTLSVPLGQPASRRSVGETRYPSMTFAHANGENSDAKSDYLIVSESCVRLCQSDAVVTATRYANELLPPPAPAHRR